MKNAEHESYPIAMQNLCVAMGKAGYSDTDDIITAWEMEDRFLFILEDGEGSGNFVLSEFYKDAGEFGGDDLEHGSLSECWIALEHLQEKGRDPARYYLEIYCPGSGNAEWQRLSEVSIVQKEHFDRREDNVNGVIEVAGVKHRIQTVIPLKK